MVSRVEFRMWIQAPNAKLRSVAWLIAIGLLPACSLTFGYPDAEAESSAALCSDDTDNDYNGATDCDDASCDGYCVEQDSVRCTDGRDNDGDGLIDDLDPRCWDIAERQVVRCASTEPTVFEERFDGSVSSARWQTFGEVAGAPVAESQPPADRGARTDGVFGTRSTATSTIAGLVSTRVFDGEWPGMSISMSARLDEGGFLRAALVPAALAPEGQAPTDGADTASIGLELDARSEASIVLAVENQRYVTAWNAPAWQDVQLSVSDGRFVVSAAGEEVLSAPFVPMVPSRLVIWSASGFWESGVAPAQIDDLQLVFSGAQPCGAPSPQIPFGSSCREHVSKLAQDVGFTVAVASSSQSAHCALLTAAPTGKERPTGVQSWSSNEGDVWELGSKLSIDWGGTLTGAGIAWDAATATYRAVVGVERSGHVALMVGSSTDCANWDMFEEVATLSSTAEAPSYVVPGVAAKHEIYVTYPASDTSGRSLWRLRSDDGKQFVLEAQAVAEFDTDQYVAAPVSVSRYGPRDVCIVYPIATHASERGLGLLVADDDLSRWRVAKPWPVLQPGSERGGFDADALTAGALSFHDQRALLLYAGRGQPLPSVDASGGNVLSTGTAWLYPPGKATPLSSELGNLRVCGNGTCDSTETCESCPIDCDPCDGERIFSDSFETLEAWQLVEPTGDVVAKPLYWSPATQQINLDPQQPGWLTHKRPNFAGDFDLSFDLHVVAPSIGSTEGCTAYVGVGEMPLPHAMDPRGVFLQVDQSLSCSRGAPTFSPRVRTGESKRITSLSVNGLDCSGMTLGVAEAWHHVALRRENGLVSIRVWGPDGCELTSDDAQVGYLGALPDIDTILVGWASTFGDEGWATACGDTGAFSVDNIVLRTLRCPDGSLSCDDGNGRVACVDINENPEHCGQCFTPVGPAEVCEAGQPMCQGTLCQDVDTGVEVCADLLESDLHCGSCGVELTEHEVCRAGLRQAKMLLMPPGFYIDTTEVTRAQYEAWLATDPPIDGVFPGCDDWKSTHRPACGWPPKDRGNFPVRCVDWCDAYAYCDAMGKHLCGRIGGGPLRSETEEDTELHDQWYHACTSNGLNQWAYGNEYEPEACNSVPLAEVASMPGCQSSEPQYAGVYDLCGSAEEWTRTCSESEESCRKRSVAASDTGMDCVSNEVSWRRTPDADTGFRCCAL